jgi:hypothetical protein
MKSSTIVGALVGVVICAVVYGIVMLGRTIFGAQQPPNEQSGAVAADLRGVFELEDECYFHP